MGDMLYRDTNSDRDTIVKFCTYSVEIVLAGDVG